MRKSSSPSNEELRRRYEAKSERGKARRARVNAIEETLSKAVTEGKVSVPKEIREYLDARRSV